MGIEGIVLKDHGDVAVFRLHVVHQLIADPQLTCGDLLQACDHTQRGGFAAAGRANQDNKFLVRDLQVELLYGHDAFGRDLQVGLPDLFALLGLLFLFGVGVDFLQVLQDHFCHNS